MLRLIISVLLLLVSLLILFKAPLHFLWLLAVVITNYPYIFMLLSSALFISCFWAAKLKLAGMFISFVSLVIYTLPVLSAYKQAGYLQDNFTKAFPSTYKQGQLKQPYSFFAMFAGIGIKDVVPQILTYKTVDGKNLTLDYYPSSSNNPSPVIVVVHGGSWENGDSKQFIDFNSYFASRGYNIAAINYRLAPAYQSPAPMDDTKDAVAWLTNNAPTLKIDTSNIVLLGRSAGAQIALVAAYSSHNPNIKGVIDFYGPADMVWGGQVKPNNLMLNTNQIYKDYFGGIYNEVPQNFKANSACEYVNASTIPTLIIHGEIDAMVSHIHSEHLSAKLAQYNVSHYFVSLPFATHACDYSINSPGGQLTTYAVERFIQSVIKH